MVEEVSTFSNRLGNLIITRSHRTILVPRSVGRTHRSTILLACAAVAKCDAVPAIGGTLTGGLGRGYVAVCQHHGGGHDDFAMSSVAQLRHICCSGPPGASVVLRHDRR